MFLTWIRSPLSINNSHSLHKLLIQSFPISLPLSPSVCFCVSQLTLHPSDENAGFASRQQDDYECTVAQWLLVSVWLSCHFSIAAFLLTEMFLVSLAKPAIQQCQCSGLASALRGGRSHAGVFVLVSVCSSMHVCVSVCVWQFGK